MSSANGWLKLENGTGEGGSLPRRPALPPAANGAGGDRLAFAGPAAALPPAIPAANCTARATPCAHSGGSLSGTARGSGRGARPENRVVNEHPAGPGSDRPGPHWQAHRYRDCERIDTLSVFDQPPAGGEARERNCCTLCGSGRVPIASGSPRGSGCSGGFCLCHPAPEPTGQKGRLT